MDLALNNLQRLICHKAQQTKPNQNSTFIYFNTGQIPTLLTGAIPKGLGAIFMQNDKRIAYTSKSLSERETLCLN